VNVIAGRASFIGMCAAVLALVGCGGGGGGSTPVQPVRNTQPIVVDLGPGNFINVLFTSVTLCAPGNGNNCQTIDHVQVDTGSSGLRILASVLDPALRSLPAQTDDAGTPIVECMQFVDGFAWGPVKRADLRIAGESADSIPIQIIGDPAYSSIPADCSSTGPPENTVADFGANGIIGIGFFLQDCGTPCASSATYGLYYRCPTASTCQPTTLPVAKQVQNPGALFGSDNNGAIIDLPAISPSGAATAGGSLIFGIGTQSNNGLGNATAIPVDADIGNFVTVYAGRSYRNSYFDSGSGALFFGTSEFPACRGIATGLYCPASLQTLSAILRGDNGASRTITFNVANAEALLSANPTFVAFGNVAAPNSDPTSFDWGLPFFYGRRVYTAYEGRPTPAGPGPYVAF
jgi:hypothetical protein